MRVIKFRAWSPSLKKMLAVTNLSWFWTCKGDGDFTNNGVSAAVGESHEGFDKIMEGAADTIIMQFTGLLDKNGKEIYEGDILAYEVLPTKKHPKRKPYTNYLEVFWNAKKGCWRMKSKDYEHGAVNFCTHEVAGNIHKTPELLT